LIGERDFTEMKGIWVGGMGDMKTMERINANEASFLFVEKMILMCSPPIGISYLQ
jgi:hypothetical protein